MQITIRHTLIIQLDEPVPRLLLHLLMTPQSGPAQRVVDWTLSVSGQAKQVPMSDCYGNKVLFASLTGIEGPLEISASGTVEMLDNNGVLGWPMGEPVPWLYHRMTPTTRAPASIWGKFRGEAGQGGDQLGVMHALMERIHETYAATSAGEQSQTQGDGATQSQSQSQGETPARSASEHAETFVGSARALGMPARFVSGFVLPEGDSVESGAHAWAEAFVQGLGWIAFDPKLNICPTNQHVRVAVGLDAPSAASIRAYPPVGDDAIRVEAMEILVADGASR